MNCVEDFLLFVSIYNVLYAKIDRSRAIANVSKGMVKKGDFPILYIQGNLAQNVSLNGHKMAKNASNELIFGPEVYFYGFYQILKGF